MESTSVSVPLPSDELAAASASYPPCSSSPAPTGHPTAMEVQQPDNEVVDPNLSNNNSECAPVFHHPVDVPMHRGRTTAAVGSQQGVVPKAPVASRFLSATKASLERMRNHKEEEASTGDCSSRSHSRSTERRLTVPVAPKLRSVSRSRERPMSREEREMKEVEEARAAEEERMRRNRQFMMANKARSSAPVQATVRSTKELTIPSTPIAHLSKRLGEKKYSTTSSPHAEEDSIVSYTVPPGGMTQPEPFVFRTDARAAASHTGVVKSAEDVPTAGEAAMQFMSDPRSHYVPNIPLQLTEASSPKLRTKARAQSTGRPRPKSFQEREEEAMAEASKHVFKFKPVDKKIFNSMGELGVPKVPAKDCTTFEEFKFRYEGRAAVRQQQHAQPSDPVTVFKALPMPDFSKPSSSVNVQQVAPVTRPVSPKLSGGQRASSAPARRQRPHHDEARRMKEQQEAEERERSKRHLSLTEPQAFNFRTEERGKAFQAVLEHRIRQEQEEERRQRDFKAQPILKTVETPFVPQPCKQELTEFQEFHFVTDSIHEVTEARLRAQEERERQQQEEQSKFHARPVPKSIEAGRGFVPQLEEKEPTKPLKVALQSDERAEKRRRFEEDLARRQRVLEEEKARIREMEARKENEEIQELRRKPVSEGGMSFKAAPVFKPAALSGASVRASVVRALGISSSQSNKAGADASTYANAGLGFEAGL